MKQFDRLIIVLLIISGVFILNYLGEAGLDQIRSRLTVSQTTSEQFDLNTDKLPDFWEIDEIINEELNVTILNSILNDNINITQLSFSSGNYNNEPISIFAEIRKLTTISQPQPAIIFIHGFGGNHTQANPFVENYSNKGYITISIDLPGFEGDSIGLPLISPETLNISSEDPKSSSIYFLEKAVIKTISLATTLTEVNQSQIFLVGASLGGVLSIYATALDTRISASAIFLASGDFANGIEYGGLLNAFFPRDLYPAPLENNDVRNYLQFYDPLIYARHSKVPIFYSIGTNDEFFSIESANKTFSYFPTTKSLSFIPNQNHDLTIDLTENTVDTWLNATIYDSPSLPEFRVTQLKKEDIISEKMEILIVIHSTLPVESIRFHYKENYMGTEWKSLDLQNTYSEYNTTIAYYTLEAPLITTPIIWFVTAELSNGASFSSLLFENTLSNIMFLPWLSFLGIILVLPLVIQFYLKYRRLTIRGIDTNTKNQVALLISEIVAIVAIQGLYIYSTLSLPWFIVKYQDSYKLTWDLPTFLNLVPINNLIGYGVVFLLYLGLVVSLASPRVGWIFGAVTSIFFLVITAGFLSTSFGYTYGFFLALILPILQLLVAIAFHRFILKVVWEDNNTKLIPKPALNH
ncbi:MAG: alpha/beta hydrolase [Candidatus Hodarchaeales archaeon]|jgi:cephalosporin-C deacetylase-like acetyl esterase